MLALFYPTASDNNDSFAYVSVCNIYFYARYNVYVTVIDIPCCHFIDTIFRVEIILLTLSCTLHRAKEQLFFASKLIYFIVRQAKKRLNWLG